MEHIKKRLKVLDGLKGGLPIGIGYLPIAMAFGILAKGSGVTFFETLGFSFIVFAGASQFVAVGMIAMGASGIEIIVTTLFLNFRHFLMSASLASQIHIEHRALKPIIAFFVTDESFSVASFDDGQLTDKYMIPMELIPYFCWGVGSGIGYLLGSILPPLLQASMGIGLYAMFVALLIPEVKKTKKAIVLSIMSALVNMILNVGFGVKSGWSIVFSIIIVASLGVALYYNEEPDATEVTEEANYE